MILPHMRFKHARTREVYGTQRTLEGIVLRQAHLLECHVTGEYSQVTKLTQAEVANEGTFRWMGVTTHEQVVEECGRFNKGLVANSAFGEVKPRFSTDHVDNGLQ